MGELAGHADLITPNLTEAALLLEEDYDPAPGRDKVRAWLERLSLEGRRSVVLAGVTGGEDQVGAGCLDRETGKCSVFLTQRVPGSYSGTGDLFASVLTGGFLTGDSLPMAMGRASYFVERCIKTTFSYSSDTRYGVMLEKELGALIDRQNVKDFSLL